MVTPVKSKSVIDRCNQNLIQQNNLYEDFINTNYDPHNMLNSICYWPTPTEQKVKRKMSKYQTKIYNPKNGEVIMSENSNEFYEVNDIIKFSNRDLISEKIAGKKFLVTKRIFDDNYSIISLDDDIIALCLAEDTLLDLGAAKIGYRREKPTGFWSIFRSDIKYEIVSLTDEQV